MAANRRLARCACDKAITSSPIGLIVDAQFRRTHRYVAWGSTTMYERNRASERSDVLCAWALGTLTFVE
jgi:hypothetical protein